MRMAGILLVIHNVPEKVSDNETLYGIQFFFFLSTRILKMIRSNCDGGTTLSEALVSLPKSVQESDKIVPRLGHHRFDCNTFQAIMLSTVYKSF
jgi:hypothetical protein